MAGGWLSKVAGVLSKGAEIATGIGIFYGWAEEKLTGMIKSRFGLDDQAERDQLIALSERGVQAGQVIGGLARTDQIDPQEIPVNPYLYGDDPAGRRGRYVGEFQVFPGERWYRADVDVADFGTLEELLEGIYNQGADWISKSPQAFGLAPDVQVEPNDVRIVFIERKF